MYDLVIVGTGFASSFFLKKYLETASKDARVLVLERGEFFPHSKRLALQRGELAPDKNKVPRAASLFDNDNPAKPWRFSLGFGGSSNCWWGCTPRFMPSDFQLQSKYGVGLDWPIDYSELAPFYDEAERLMAISGPKDTPFPRETEYPQPPHNLSSVDKIMQEAYGQNYIVQPTARARVAVGNRAACCATGVCKLCPIDAKFTIENSMQTVFKDPRVEVRHGAAVRNVLFTGDVATAVEFKSGEKIVSAKGEIIALGTNALFNANILLNSGDTSPSLGRGLSEQIGYNVTVHLDDLQNLEGGTSITANGYMHYDGEHRSKYSACLLESHFDHDFRIEKGKWRSLAKFKLVFEDLPDDENRVVVTDDPFRPKVVYKGHAEYAEKGYEAVKAQADKLFSPLPVEEIFLPNQPNKTESHILCTTRMGESPKNSVIDANLIHHRYRNLFVLGGGAFPTNSPSNPTLTISALSLRAAAKGL